MTQPPQDAELIERIINGDKQLFAVLVDRYKNKIYGIFYGMGASHQDAQDLAQETFIRIYRNLPSHRQGSSFFSWMYTIAVNLMRDHQRKKKPVLTSDTPEAVSPDEKTPEQQLLHQEMKREIHQQLDELPELYRLVLLLKYTNELSYEEIADIANMSTSQVKNALYRGKKMLKARIERKGGILLEAKIK
ncbi:RNA polymerase sigma factor [Paenibacillus lactis]|jgi:RNA polymerase sigma-70 factor (ECF subfamily)|uniref:RNA polymerase, sigma-24 subunit, ECF subfamily n=1 Tax=Paenibacillus lactis 154 TaxID=743719 RepID=G4HP80_9BACL|nr:sigma-70 family RNA polymerase sigma factor [Paenibacillus lactis]EHB48917.1 RNA polymerase, sigma-24 subunit, ECF subfamily [Paenibacillus lactis 154]